MTTSHGDGTGVGGRAGGGRVTGAPGHEGRGARGPRGRTPRVGGQGRGEGIGHAGVGRGAEGGRARGQGRSESNGRSIGGSNGCSMGGGQGYPPHLPTRNCPYPPAIKEVQLFDGVAPVWGGAIGFLGFALVRIVLSDGGLVGVCLGDCSDV